MAPGKKQLWHIGNFGANTFVNLLAYWVQDADSSNSYINIFKTFH